jgi:hypothetical protein
MVVSDIKYKPNTYILLPKDRRLQYFDQKGFFVCRVAASSNKSLEKTRTNRAFQFERYVNKGYTHEKNTRYTWASFY